MTSRSAFSVSSECLQGSPGQRVYGALIPSHSSALRVYPPLTDLGLCPPSPCRAQPCHARGVHACVLRTCPQCSRVSVHGEELQGVWSSWWNFTRTCQAAFHHGCTIRVSPPSESFPLSLGFCRRYSGGRKWYLIVVGFTHSFEQLLMSFVAICVSLFGELSSSFAYFCTELFLSVVKW